MKEQLKIYSERIGGMLITAGIAAGFAFLTSLADQQTMQCLPAIDPVTAGASGATMRAVYQAIAFGTTGHGA